MLDLISRFHTFFTARVGRCRTCMRLSLAAALAVWGVFGIGLLIWPDGLVQNLIGLSALGLTTLWILHVAAYAARAQARSRDEQPAGRGMTSTALARTEPGIDRVDRRRALGVLLRAAGVAVVASVPVLLWPSDAFAFCGQCKKNEDCGVGFVCKNTAPVGSGKVCMECKPS